MPAQCLRSLQREAAAVCTSFSKTVPMRSYLQYIDPLSSEASLTTLSIQRWIRAHLSP